GLRGMGSAKEKKAILGMYQRGGELRLHHVTDSMRATLKPIILAHIAPGSRVHTDEAKTYLWMKSQYAHAKIGHSFREYVKGDVTTNRIEGVFSHFKRGVTGVYHQISDQHLDRYLQMFAYRWNRRDMGESERVNDLLRATKGRRIDYKTLIQ